MNLLFFSLFIYIYNLILIYFIDQTYIENIIYLDLMQDVGNTYSSIKIGSIFK